MGKEGRGGWSLNTRRGLLVTLVCICMRGPGGKGRGRNRIHGEQARGHGARAVGHSPGKFVWQGRRIWVQTTHTQIAFWYVSALPRGVVLDPVSPPSVFRAALLFLPVARDAFHPRANCSPSTLLPILTSVTLPRIHLALPLSPPVPPSALSLSQPYILLFCPPCSTFCFALHLHLTSKSLNHPTCRTRPAQTSISISTGVRSQPFATSRSLYPPLQQACMQPLA